MTISRWGLAFAMALAVLGGAAQAEDRPDSQASRVEFAQSPLRVVTASGRAHAFTVELAETPDQLTQGLMFRTHMKADAGMLFNFGRPRPVSMWMKNTLIALDMVFIDQTGRVVGIHAGAVPHSEAVISSPSPVLSVLELNAGNAARLGLKAGDRVEHPWFKH
ncbi:conserved exported hypothetical protein [Magnetospirillum sp. LM-5]|uniref:DUF192 domain-containing protein n=1 Tax=Magnetospirillum sp. LM-5 TaxID=2681466 RepID=UPI00137DFE56|nr:DUF192 domain-containing protein [Magnetospirillum sp. LM-5]CAA7611523.1 conserved exported hypothetical protein [Magnetospirillum sp. LM-5]